MTDWKGISLGLGLEFGGGAENGGSEARRGWRLGLAEALAEMTTIEFKSPSRNFTIRYIQLNGMLYVSYRISHETDGNIFL